MAQQNLQHNLMKMQAGDILFVVHDFDARSTDELTLRKGEKVELVELDDGFGDGWYLGRHLSRGGTGLFPGVYTTKLPTTFPNLQTMGAIKRSSLPNQPYTPQASYAVQSRQNEPQFQSPEQPPRPQQSLQGANGSQQISSQAIPATFSQRQPSDAKRTASMPPMQSSYNSQIPRSMGQNLADPHAGQDSPVMNETLSVIAEHMQDMNTPRHSMITQEPSPVDDSESEYSSHLDHPHSDVAGPETDEEEGERLTEDEVRRWDHRQTANHLRSIGVDPKHCDIFEEQEISGEVLLEMDQAFIYMREYDFGVMGRRLKTWHKIRDFQDEVKGPRMSRQSTSTGVTHGDSAEDLARSHGRMASSGATILPRIPKLTENPGLIYRSQQQVPSLANDSRSMPQPLHTQSNAGAVNRTSVHGSSPSSPWRASVAPDSPSRPSAALVREISHSRRHSSIDFSTQPSFDMPVSSLEKPVISHKKQLSFDREWSMTSATPMTNSTNAPSLRLNTMRQPGYESSVDASVHTDLSSIDLVDRGYFSGGELENRKSRNLLRKKEDRGSPAHSRQVSMQPDTSINAAAAKRHSRLGSVDSIKDSGAKVTSPAARAYHSKGFKGRMRSASERTAYSGPYTGGISPVVTNLEVDQLPKSPLSSAQTGSESKANISPVSPFNSSLTGPNRIRRIMGMRVISDAVTGNEKASASTPGSGPSTVAESPADSLTGSTTPSRTSKSFEAENVDLASKGLDIAGPLPLPKSSSRPRPKTKQETSAYTRGLQKISPEEARNTCDYSGWMKKKSSSLLTTWKPRLFILRGRRLSYYYSENDTEERGIIDISGHKVLVANSDPITTLHASITGATASPVPTSAKISSESSQVATRSQNSSTDGPFYFKLIPPKAGLSRAVQFTKPTVHYFQVDSIIEGRKWMGEMMKATIEHDLSTFETTNKQKTISLAKAKARRERPPALKETDETVENGADDSKMDEEGLKIQGLSLEKANNATSLSVLMEEKAKAQELSNGKIPDTEQNSRLDAPFVDGLEESQP